jgi:hypothetical protein
MHSTVVWGNQFFSKVSPLPTAENDMKNSYLFRSIQPEKRKNVLNQLITHDFIELF